MVLLVEELRYGSWRAVQRCSGSAILPNYPVQQVRDLGSLSCRDVSRGRFPWSLCSHAMASGSTVCATMSSPTFGFGHHSSPYSLSQCCVWRLTIFQIYSVFTWVYVSGICEFLGILPDHGDGRLNTFSLFETWSSPLIPHTFTTLWLYIRCVQHVCMYTAYQT